LGFNSKIKYYFLKMFIDEVKIEVKGGKGGNGKVHFDTSKFGQGPDGGDGGDGGGVFVVGVSNLGALSQFRFKKEFHAEDGQYGMVQKKHGRNGEDVFLRVPVGTIVHNLTTGLQEEVLQVDQKIEIASGGIGGRGNFEFRSSTNTTPKEAEEGKEGDDFEILLELQLIAAVGFIGLPNVGKSSMLNELTAASAKVANYKFTTLEPNLGVLDELIIADIPGLIEGASEGRGLGHKFLRHIKRTKILIHFLSAESDDLKRDYETVKKELENYDPELKKKEKYIFLSKYDVLKKEELDEKLKELKKISKNILPVSIYDPDSIENVRMLLHKLVKKNIKVDTNKEGKNKV
jgi:GTP-binding protein